jgi:predicted HicB family RNase H-like nuclease
MEVLRNYRRIVFWSDEDQEYVAICPAFGMGVSALAETPEAALTELHTVLGMVLESYAEHGDPLPPPDALPAEYSGKFLVRMPKSLHRRLAEQSEAEGVSLNAYVNMVLAAAVGAATAPQPEQPVAIAK